MAEDPIKLFSTRAERYPEPTDMDRVHGTARAALAAIPIVGGTLTELMSMVLAPAIERRRDAWFRELADAFEEVEKKVAGFKVHDLQKDDAFISTVIQASRAAVGTHQQEKRNALRNAVLNVALSKSPDEEKQRFFLTLVENLSVTHLEILKLFANPGAFPAGRRDELRQQRTLTDPMVVELNDRGLLVDPRPYAARMREAPESLTQAGWILSPLGKEFLVFIASPEQLK